VSTQIYNIRPYTSSDKEIILNLLSANSPLYFAEEEKSDLEHYLDKEIEDYFVILALAE